MKTTARRKGTTMKTTFTFYCDPSHGWLKISVNDLAAVGLTTADISHYSYRKNNSLYLEEDQDAGIFLKAFEAKHGAKPAIKESYTNRDSHIRRMERI